MKLLFTFVAFLFISTSAVKLKLAEERNELGFLTENDIEEKFPTTISKNKNVEIKVQSVNYSKFLEGLNTNTAGESTVVTHEIKINTDKVKEPSDTEWKQKLLKIGMLRKRKNYEHQVPSEKGEMTLNIKSL